MRTERDTPRILLVEDEALIAMDKARTIEAFGYEVDTALRGTDAVAMATDGAFYDLVITDIDLGSGMDGTEVARQILSCRDVPVLFMSSHTEPEVVEKTEEITSYGYVVKSSSPTVLGASIKMALRLYAANRSVREERNNLKAVTKSSPVGILQIDHRLEVVQANPAAERIAGRRLDELSAPRCGDFLGCATLLRPPYACGTTDKCSGCLIFHDLLRTTRDGAESDEREIEVEVLDPESETGRRSTWLRYKTTPLATDGNQGALVTFSDVTAERNKNQRMRLLSAVAESRATLVVITNRDREIEWVNESFVELTGYTLDEVIGLNPGRFLQGEGTDPLVIERLRAAVDRGEAYQCELLNYRKDGTPYWIYLDIQPVRDGEGTLTHFVSMQHDVSDRNRYEHALIEADARKRAIVEKSNDGIVAFDGGGSLVYANRSYERLTGYSLTRLMGLDRDEVFDQIHPDHADRLREQIFGALKLGHGDLLYRYLFRSSSGEYLPREDRLTAFFDGTGAFQELWVIARTLSAEEYQGYHFEIVEGGRSEASRRRE